MMRYAMRFALYSPDSAWIIIAEAKQGSLRGWFEFVKQYFRLISAAMALDRWAAGLTKMDGHHLILGELVDRITGETLPDTHDERYRQKIADLLLDNKGYLKSDVQPRVDLILQADSKRARIKIDFLIDLANYPSMLIKYGPGSLVTRRRPSLAAARLVTPYQIPVVVVTNGEDAEIIDGRSGTVIAAGLKSILSREELIKRLDDHVWEKIAPERAEMESRIAYCYEIDGACPCDDAICQIS